MSAAERAAAEQDPDAEEDHNWMTAPEEVNFYADSDTFHFDSYTVGMGRCRLTVSKPELKARLVSAISA